MRVWVTMVLILFAVVLTGPTAPVGADHSTNACAANQGQVTVALGNLYGALPVQLDALSGLAYVDMPFDSCTDGGFSIHSDSGDIHGTRNCAERYVRVWSVPGSAGEDFTIFWKYPGQNGCGT